MYFITPVNKICLSTGAVKATILLPQLHIWRLTQSGAQGQLSYQFSELYIQHFRGSFVNLEYLACSSLIFALDALGF